MGRTHALSGLAAGLAVYGAATVGSIRLGAGLGGLSPAFVALGALVTACAALLPDLDTPSSTASTALPPVTGWVSRRLTPGGHRAITHCLVGIAAAIAVVTVVCAWTATSSGLVIRPGNGLILGLCAAVGARTMGVSPRAGLALWAAAFGGFLVGAAAPATPWWLMPTSVGLGMWIHRLGDALTTQGVENLLWPLVRAPRLRLPVLGDTGSAREQLLGLGLSAYVTWCGAGLVLTAVI
ncbi:metal-dependent hydrolase [Actinomyces sp. 594]|uniref:metal-dependent hydrolase n=1 Tax=Actinomyces sp. 594 TaxID=2057793 RepID=UPI001C59B3F4|nr:metal-dependent hydrolase [Actinomyces sp. 594]MBW3068963.1 metal-dependent hydrolase [Actinomyces sp. 594]